MHDIYREPYLNLILGITGVISSRKLLLNSIKTKKTQEKIFFFIFVVLFAHFGVYVVAFSKYQS